MLKDRPYAKKHTRTHVQMVWTGVQKLGFQGYSAVFNRWDGELHSIQVSPTQDPV